MKVCRSCGADITEGPLLCYEGMPSIIQNLPLEKGDALNMVVDLAVIECGVCGLVQLDGDYVVPYYKDVIRSSSVSKEMMSFRQEQFSKFANKYNCTDKRYMEVGCGSGEYLGIMKEFIPDSIGIENNPNAVLACQSDGLDVVQSYIDDVNLNSAIDAFGCFNFLEHIPRPVQFLRKIRTHLSENAVGIVEVPNFDMMGSEGVFSDFSCEHLSYFTKSSLQIALGLSGFDVLSIADIWHGHIISAEISVRHKIDPIKFKENLQKAKRDALMVIDGINKSKIAVWGAGHQSMTMILQLGIADRIGMIVDSAKTKQKRYTPGIGIQILPPDALFESGIELLIINASSYSREVFREATSRFPELKNIYLVDNTSFTRGK